MKLPEITQEIIDKFGIFDPVILIEWLVSEDQDRPKWTQAAVDFARLVSDGLLHEAREAMKAKWPATGPTTDTLGNMLIAYHRLEAEIERMRPVVEAVGRNDYVNSCHCDICKAYRNCEAKKP